MTTTLKVGALFAGYGGIELALASVLDTEPAWFSEFDKAPSAILADRWPDVPNLGDVTKVDWAAVEPVDIITGGSPCQDLSHAGKRAGMKAGTRSGLWASMCDAIDIIRPRLVVWENVRGALSASADSAVEPCPLCVGDRPGPTLRALGRVLGDLAELGYDARWYGLRAADVGAAHGRFRVFLFATPADADAARLGPNGDRARRRESDTSGGALWNQPTGRRAHGAPSWDESEDRGGHAAVVAADLTLLPTPAVNDMGAAYTPETWDAWTDRMKAEHSNGNGHGKSLNIEALRLLKTPQASENAQGRPHRFHNDGPDRRFDLSDQIAALVEDVEHLLPTPSAATPDSRRSRPDGSTYSADGYVRAQLGDLVAQQDWREYEAAIRRQEHAFGRAAPLPTEPGAKGQPRLSPRFVEWLMGLPDGWVTDVPGVSRNDQLKALGNGVVPQQCAAALRAFLTDRGAA